ncbi:dolichol-phosphate mannosyltransferase 2 [Gongronella butleri]|nr:dolichol-phosphate mannosyltransferase 2 [Gongronella butleri]
MGTGIDKVAGTAAFFTLNALFVYYSIWVLLIPFVDEGHVLHNYFPAWQHAIRVPVIIMIIWLTVILTFLGAIMVKSR